MIRPRGITVSVDFADLLSITLRANVHHLAECLVVTAPHDRETQELCAAIPGVRTFVTDEFYRHGAFFNKGAALEAAFSAYGREGWLLVFDADILFPDAMQIDWLNPTCIYGPHRRIVDDPLNWDPAAPWDRFRRYQEGPRILGYFQMFNAAAIRDIRPWYPTTYTHACGSDADFQSLWPPNRRAKLPFDVLHLGPTNANWFGRVTRRLDGTVPERSEEMAALTKRYIRYRGWMGQRPTGEAFPDRIQDYSSRMIPMSGSTSPSDSAADTFFRLYTGKLATLSGNCLYEKSCSLHGLDPNTPGLKRLVAFVMAIGSRDGIRISHPEHLEEVTIGEPSPKCEPWQPLSFNDTSCTVKSIEQARASHPGHYFMPTPVVEKAVAEGIARRGWGNEQ